MGAAGRGLWCDIPLLNCWSKLPTSCTGWWTQVRCLCKSVNKRTTVTRREIIEFLNTTTATVVLLRNSWPCRVHLRATLSQPVSVPSRPLTPRIISTHKGFEICIIKHGSISCSDTSCIRVKCKKKNYKVITSPSQIEINSISRFRLQSSQFFCFFLCTAQLNNSYNSELVWLKIN